MIRILVMSAMVLLASSVIAAEGEPAPQPEADESKASTEDAEATRAENKAQKNKSKDKEIFIPSEEISEDFAVSFPVDI